jgi:hypothetical protein
VVGGFLLNVAIVVSEAEILIVRHLACLSALDGSAAYIHFSLPKLSPEMEQFTQLFGSCRVFGLCLSLF